MIVHDEAYETRDLQEFDAGIYSFCGVLDEDLESEDGTLVAEMVMYEGETRLLIDTDLVIDCEACILIKFQIDSTK